MLDFHIWEEKKMLVIYDFIRSLFDKYGKYSLHHWLFMISGPVFSNTENTSWNHFWKKYDKKRNAEFQVPLEHSDDWYQWLDKNIEWDLLRAWICIQLFVYSFILLKLKMVFLNENETTLSQSSCSCFSFIFYSS